MAEVKQKKLPPLSCRSPQTFHFDTTRFPFQEILLEIFQLYPSLKGHPPNALLGDTHHKTVPLGSVLASLHLQEPRIAQGVRKRSSNRAQTRRGTLFNAAYHRILRSGVNDLPPELGCKVLALRKRFDALVCDFVGEVVGPLLGADKVCHLNYLF